MHPSFPRSELALAAGAALAIASLAAAPIAASAGNAKSAGHYVTGDFHNHTTCSDGTISMQKLVKKATDKIDTPWGLDWFVQAGHGGNGNRNCTLTEDATLATPAYPFISGQGPTTTWTDSIGAAKLKGDGGGVGGTGNMWRWQSIQEYQYPLLEYLSAYKQQPLFIGMESVVPGHEHSSMSVIAGQMPARLAKVKLPTTPGYTALGNADALAQWSYCFDRGDTDTSRGNATGTSTGNNWDCSVAGSLNAGDPSWNGTAHKLMPASGIGSGTAGHLKTVEAMKWMAQTHPNESYYVPAHLERAGPFYADGNNGFNVEHLRDFNNAAPGIAFGFETQPGHGASSNRGEYQVARNTIGGVKVDSVGGTSWGGTGVYGAKVGGVWDAMLGEGRNFWYFASSDWHNRGIFGPDDRRSTQDFYPGEYARDFVNVHNKKGGPLRPQEIVDGLRSGDSFVANGQLIDRLAFVVCASKSRNGSRSDKAIATLAFEAAVNNAEVEAEGCATMGQKLTVAPGSDVVVAISLRDPEGTSYSPYVFDNPSLLQVGIHQKLNQPVLDHVDLVRGLVTGYKQPGAPDYAGAWPNTWLANPDLATVPDAAKNLSAAVIRSFGASGKSHWTALVSPVDQTKFLTMAYRIPAVTASQYVRLRGTNMPPAVPSETDASGNPLADVFTNANDLTKLTIPCTTVGTVLEGDKIDGCPAHLPVVNGVKMVAYDVAAWSDLWFYANPVFIEVTGSTRVAGVK
jgi:hypothetical protein